MKGRIFSILLIVVGTTIGGVIIASQLDLNSRPFLLFGYILGILMIVTGVIAAVLCYQRQGIQKPVDRKPTASSEVKSTKRTTHEAITAPKLAEKIIKFLTTDGGPRESEAVVLAREFKQWGLDDDADYLVESMHDEGIVPDSEYREWNDRKSRDKSNEYLDWPEI